MTCIIGIIDREEKCIYIGADSAGSSGYDVTIRKDPKVFKTGDFLFGCTTSFRMIQLLRFSLKIKKRKNKGVYNFMCTDFVDAVRKCFVDGGYMQKYIDGDEKGGTFLVGYKGRLFKVSSDFQVEEAKEDYNSCGSGVSFAKGSLYSDKSRRHKDRLLNALRCAEHNNGAVRRPFLVKKLKY